MYACTLKKNFFFKSWPGLWRKKISLICNSSSALAAWELRRRAPWRLVALTVGPLRKNALGSLLFIVSVPAELPPQTLPFSLAAGIVIGAADSCLPGRLKLPSCALCRRSASQHYCSC